MPSDDERDTRLLRWYRRYLGQPEATTPVYAGFAAFFAGIALTVVGVGTFLWSTGFSMDDLTLYAIREVAGVAGALGLPLVLLGATVLLPVDRRGTYAALLGTGICVVATALFVNAYPYNWNVPGPADASVQVVPLYAGGVVVAAAATGAALVTFHLERTAGATVERPDEGGADEPEVTDEQVRRDIDAAMENTTLSWGGIEKREGKRLQLNTGSEADVDRRGLEHAKAKTTRMSNTSVDSAVDGLKQMRGGNVDKQSGGGTDDQAAALKQLREQQRKNEEAAGEAGFLDRARAWLRSVRS